MAKSILVEEYHVSVLAPRGLPDRAYLAMRRQLRDRRFQAALRQALGDLMRRHPSLNEVRIRLSW
jgi:hypothetical protein